MFFSSRLRPSNLPSDSGRVFVNFLHQGFGIVGAVVLHNLRRVAIVYLYNELAELAPNGVVELLQELKSSALRTINREFK